MDNFEKEAEQELGPVKDLPVTTCQGIAAIALQMAMKYHDMGMVKDGALYQQHKLEGKNLQPLNLDVVFETAIQIEKHLLQSNERIAMMVVEAVTSGIDENLDEEIPLD